MTDEAQTSPRDAAINAFAALTKAHSKEVADALRNVVAVIKAQDDLYKDVAGYPKPIADAFNVSSALAEKLDPQAKVVTQ